MKIAQIKGFLFFLLLLSALLFLGFEVYGKLPGDIEISKQNSNAIIPLSSALILSILVNAGIHLLEKMRDSKTS